jgi:hypothetical protein
VRLSFDLGLNFVPVRIVYPGFSWHCSLCIHGIPPEQHRRLEQQHKESLNITKVFSTTFYRFFKDDTISFLPFAFFYQYGFQSKAKVIFV